MKVSRKGRLQVSFGNQELILSPGQTATTPKLTNQRFYNPSNTGEVVSLAKVEPAMEPFEKRLYILYGLAEDGLTDGEGVPQSLVDTAIFSYMTNSRLTGWGVLLKPILCRCTILRVLDWRRSEAREEIQGLIPAP